MLESMFGRSSVTIERRNSDMCKVSQEEIEMLTQMAFAHPQKAKKIGIVYVRKNGFRIQLVKLTKRHYSKINSESLVSLKFDRSEIDGYMKRVKFLEQSDISEEEVQKEEPEICRRRIRRNTVVKSRRPLYGRPTFTHEGISEKINNICSQLFLEQKELETIEKLDLAQKGIDFFCQFIKEIISNKQESVYNSDSEDSDNEKGELTESDESP